MKSERHIAVVGAGLVGSLAALYLVKRGNKVTVFERRPDMRKSALFAGRSINLALSSRGLLALEELGLADKTKQIAIPMRGRMMHDLKGNLTSQSYGKDDQYINSVSRSDLNIMLIDAAESCGVKFEFEKRCLNIDLEKTSMTLTTNDFIPGVPTVQDASELKSSQFDLILGADGAFSAVRGSLQFTDRFDFSQDYIDHGYKELHIPAGANGKFQLEKNALHIWPRESFMMIALPNPDGSFTCTLFFPFEGPISFKALDTNEKILVFFKETFPDAVPLMPTLLDDFNTNPTGSLVTMKCFPWVRNKTLLIGDAAHAIVPFYGQGMNAGFEDCRILNDLLNKFSDDWEKVLSVFQESRKPDTDAIAQLALDNFIEMRDLVADREFLLRKKIEAKLHMLYPDRWIPLYTMVTFSPQIRYSNAQTTGQKQNAIMDRIMAMPDIENTWQNLDFGLIVDQLN
jgi:kynurenine 3-monooxygenase